MSLYGFDLWAMALTFARIGSVMMLLPGFGEPVVPARVRLGLALLVCVLIAPLAAPVLPPAPPGLGAAAALLIGEIAIGLGIGLIARALVSALASAGQIVGLETGLAFAQTTDPSNDEVNQVFSVFFALLGVTLALAADLHHDLLRGLFASYDLFAPGSPGPLGDWLEAAVGAIGDSFRIALQICAPLILAGLVYRAGLGVLSRVIPQIQVFFITIPLNLLGGFLVVALGLSLGMLIWLDRMRLFALTLG